MIVYVGVVYEYKSVLVIIFNDSFIINNKFSVIYYV
jgi:hypothetical protein